MRRRRPSLLRPLLASAVAWGLVAPAPAGAQERLNRTIETLEAGHPTFGLATGTFSLTNARALATSELDFVIIDMEHSPFDVETLRTFLLGMVDVGRAVEKGSPQMDVTPIVRIPMNGRENLQFLVKQALDVGAYGVMFPFIGTREQALNAVASMRYPQRRGDARPEPRGLRGSSPGNARWVWGVRDYTARADVWPLDPRGELLAVLQIETPEGVENIDEIASVPGVGAIFIGPADLSLNYGVPGDHPEMVAAIQRVLEACQANDVPCGLTTGAGSVEERLAQGFDFVTISWGGDAGISGSAAAALEIAREASGRDGGD
jgi:4-hydroxy-2-oxoheptanedioate aldolase